MVLEVPRFKDIPTVVTSNLQDRLNGVTDVLTRVSKLVFEDLEKAVNAAVSADEEGNVPSLGMPAVCSALFAACLSSLLLVSRFTSGQKADPSCRSQSGRSVPPGGEGGPYCL